MRVARGKLLHRGDVMFVWVLLTLQLLAESCVWQPLLYRMLCSFLLYLVLGSLLYLVMSPRSETWACHRLALRLGFPSLWSS